MTCSNESPTGPDTYWNNRYEDFWRQYLLRLFAVENYRESFFRKLVEYCGHHPKIENLQPAEREIEEFDIVWSDDNITLIIELKMRMVGNARNVKTQLGCYAKSAANEYQNRTVCLLLISADESRPDAAPDCWQHISWKAFVDNILTKEMNKISDCVLREGWEYFKKLGEIK